MYVCVRVRVSSNLARDRIFTDIIISETNAVRKPWRENNNREYGRVQRVLTIKLNYYLGRA